MERKFRVAEDKSDRELSRDLAVDSNITRIKILDRKQYSLLLHSLLRAVQGGCCSENLLECKINF